MYVLATTLSSNFVRSIRCSCQSIPWRKGVGLVETPAGGPGGGVGKKDQTGESEDQEEMERVDYGRKVDQ